MKWDTSGLISHLRWLPSLRCSVCCACSISSLVSDSVMICCRSSRVSRLRWRSIVVAGLSAALCWSAPCWASDRYNDQIRSAWRRYLPEYHWGLGWSQLWQESRLNPAAVSPVGAAGIGQFMPGTWRDMQQHGVVPVGTPARDARWSIVAAAYYMRQQLNGWNRSGRSAGDRYDLALSGYNAGRGHLYTAQRLCNGAMDYAGIIRCLPQVTGRHSTETINYVRLIHRHFERRYGYAIWWSE